MADRAARSYCHPNVLSAAPLSFGSRGTPYVHMRAMPELLVTADAPGSTGDNNRVRRWRSQDLATFVEVPRMTVIRSLIPAMLADGVLTQRGRYWFGRSTDVEAWLTGRWIAASPARPTRRRP